jgi:hypothetical protein
MAAPLAVLTKSCLSQSRAVRFSLGSYRRASPTSQIQLITAIEHLKIKKVKEEQVIIQTFSDPPLQAFLSWKPKGFYGHRRVKAK